MARRPIRVTRGARRKTTWLQFAPIATTTTSASEAALVFVLNTAALALRPFTVVRTRGLLELQSDQSGASEDQSVGFGLAVVSDAASAVGVTAVPTPITDMGSDLFFSHELLYNNFIQKTGVGFEAAAGVRHYFDSKAMRKVDISEDIVVVMESSAISAGLILTMGFRMLVKLH